jgi:hypothetical protein
MARSLVTQVADNEFDKLQATRNVTAKMQSQMDKIAFSLQVRSRPGPTDEQIKSKMEQRVSNLDHVLQILKLHVSSLKQIPVLARHKQLRALVTVIDAVDSLTDEAKVQGVATPLRRVRNELVSVREAVYTEVGLSDDTFRFKMYHEALSTIEELKRTTQDRLHKKDQADPRDLSHAEEDVLRQASRFQLKFPKAGSFIVTRAPIIPMLNVSAERLMQAGFKAESAGGYPIIHQQMVIGLSRDLLARESKKRPIDVADEVRRQVQKRIHQPVKFVMERAGTGRNIQGTWFWIMTDRELDHLAMVSPGKVVKIPSWGFTV